MIFADEVAAALGKAAHQRNQATGGREGGRIRRKLISEFVEAPLYRYTLDDQTDQADQNYSNGTGDQSGTRHPRRLVLSVPNSDKTGLAVPLRIEPDSP